MMTLIESPEDMDWLVEVHHVPPGYQIAILYGNEDSPYKIELFAANHYLCKPTVMTLHDGKLQITQQGDPLTQSHVHCECDDCEGYEEENDTDEERQEDDYVTEDHRHFYQYGKLVVTVPEDEDWEPYVLEHMEKHSFWPNVWFISDHGNEHLLEW